MYLRSFFHIHVMIYIHALARTALLEIAAQLYLGYFGLVHDIAIDSCWAIGYNSTITMCVNIISCIRMLSKAPELAMYLQICNHSSTCSHSHFSSAATPTSHLQPLPLLICSHSHFSSAATPTSHLQPLPLLICSHSHFSSAAIPLSTAVMLPMSTMHNGDCTPDGMLILCNEWLAN